jgi:hypothetical protein
MLLILISYAHARPDRTIYVHSYFQRNEVETQRQLEKSSHRYRQDIALPEIQVPVSVHGTEIFQNLTFLQIKMD